MTDLPEGVARGLSSSQRDTVDAWWRGLDGEERREFGKLWDERSEQTAYYAVDVDGKTEWHELPIKLRGFFVDHETHRENAMWKQQLCEYVNGHEVRFFIAEKSFHVCRAHAVAREVIATGTIPHDFACPFASEQCPFAAALAASDGRSVWLLPVLR
jgi:hypothetical protein